MSEKLTRLDLPAPEGYAYVAKDEYGQVVFVPEETQPDFRESEVYSESEQSPIVAKYHMSIEAEGPIGQLMNELQMQQSRFMQPRQQPVHFMPTSQPLSVPTEDHYPIQPMQPTEEIPTLQAIETQESPARRERRASRTVVLLGMTAGAALISGIVFSAGNQQSAESDVATCTADKVISTVLEDLPCFADKFASKFTTDTLFNYSSEDTK